VGDLADAMMQEFKRRIARGEPHQRALLGPSPISASRRTEAAGVTSKRELAAKNNLRLLAKL
jgi:hypothetical protein